MVCALVMPMKDCAGAPATTGSRALLCAEVMATVGESEMGSVSYSICGCLPQEPEHRSQHPLRAWPEVTVTPQLPLEVGASLPGWVLVAPVRQLARQQSV